MDTGEGKFMQATEESKELFERLYPNHGGWFREGEIVELRGSQFRVKRIKPTEITLKLVKRAIGNS